MKNKKKYLMMFFIIIIFTIIISFLDKAVIEYAKRSVNNTPMFITGFFLLIKFILFYGLGWIINIYFIKRKETVNFHDFIVVSVPIVLLIIMSSLFSPLLLYFVINESSVFSTIYLLLPIIKEDKDNYYYEKNES